MREKIAPTTDNAREHPWAPPEAPGNNTDSTENATRLTSASAFHRAQSIRRQPSEQSAGSELGEKDQAVAHEAITSEAFLSTLLRKGSVQRI